MTTTQLDQHTIGNGHRRRLHAQKTQGDAVAGVRLTLQLKAATAADNDATQGTWDV
jgi:hypothetical protein